MKISKSNTHVHVLGDGKHVIMGMLGGAKYSRDPVPGTATIAFMKAHENYERKTIWGNGKECEASKPIMDNKYCFKEKASLNK